MCILVISLGNDTFRDRVSLRSFPHGHKNSPDTIRNVLLCSVAHLLGNWDILKARAAVTLGWPEEASWVALTNYLSIPGAGVAISDPFSKQPGSLNMVAHRERNKCLGKVTISRIGKAASLCQQSGTW